MVVLMIHALRFSRFNARLIVKGLVVLLVAFHVGDVVKLQMLSTRIGGGDEVMMGIVRVTSA